MSSRSFYFVCYDGQTKSFLLERVRSFPRNGEGIGKRGVLYSPILIFTAKRVLLESTVPRRSRVIKATAQSSLFAEQNRGTFRNTKGQKWTKRGVTCKSFEHMLDNYRSSCRHDVKFVCWHREPGTKRINFIDEATKSGAGWTRALVIGTTVGFTKYIERGCVEARNERKNKGKKEKMEKKKEGKTKKRA